MKYVDLQPNGRKLNAFDIPAMRLNIGGHEILHDGHFLSADDAPNLSFLLGMDILSYFDFSFKCGERRMYYEFRKDAEAAFKSAGEPFAYRVNPRQNDHKNPSR